MVTGGVTTIALGGVSSAEAASLINGGFEDLQISGGVQQVDANLINGWETTATNNNIEIQTERLFHEGALGTSQYAELNATEVSTLFQDVDTTAGTTLNWRFFHRGREGEDTLKFSLIDLDTNSVLFSQNYTSNNDQWFEYTGQIVATGSRTRWEFESISAAGGNPAVGNFIDEVFFSEDPIPGVQSVPEPASVLGLLAVGALGAGTKLKKKQQG